MALTTEDQQFILQLFAQVNKRFDDLETRINKLEIRFDVLETKFDKLETRFDKLEKKVDKIDMKLDMTRADVLLVHANIEVVTDRINEMHVDLKMVKKDVGTLKEDRDHTFSLIVPKQSDHERRILSVERMLLHDSKKT